MNDKFTIHLLKSIAQQADELERLERLRGSLPSDITRMADKDKKIKELEVEVSKWKNRYHNLEDEINDSWPVSDNPEWSV